MTKEDITIGLKIYLYMPTIIDVVEFTVKECNETSDWVLLESTYYAGTRDVSYGQIIKFYFETPEEAKVKFIKDFQEVKESEIQRLEEEIKKKRALIRRAKREVKYDELINTHSDLFI